MSAMRNDRPQSIKAIERRFRRRRKFPADDELAKAIERAVYFFDSSVRRRIPFDFNRFPRLLYILVLRLRPGKGSHSVACTDSPPDRRGPNALPESSMSLKGLAVFVRASIDRGIKPFAELVADRVRWSMK
jgi:hypothetical protein